MDEDYEIALNCGCLIILRLYCFLIINNYYYIVFFVSFRTCRLRCLHLALTCLALSRLLQTSEQQASLILFQ